MGTKGKSGSSATAVSQKLANKRTKKLALAPAALKAAKKASAKAGSSPAPKAVGVSDLITIFGGAGFKSIEVEGKHLSFSGRTSEFDHAFAFENLIVLCEETTESSPNKHFTNKAFFYNLIEADLPSFIVEFGKISPEFKAHVDTCGYLVDELEFRYVYYSSTVDCDSAQNNPAPFKYLERSHATYFRELVKIIGKSAKYELLKYLNVALVQLGDLRRSGKPAQTDAFEAFCLSGKHINYPKDFCVVSFYADPASLITRAYVLRRDGWEQPDVSYQRFIKGPKLAKMREYLAENGKVFINNLIVTLPASVTMFDAKGKSVDPTKLPQKEVVDLRIPQELGTIGVVDGQHRIFAYFDGTDENEPKIAPLRVRQNLLVTGIIFPDNYGADDRVKFEAELFLSINNTQSSVRADLRQELETIINPEKPEAIAKAFVTALSRSGPLKGLIQATLNDPADRIRSASLVKYAALQLVRPDTQNGMYNLWRTQSNLALSTKAGRDSYIDFCIDHANRMLAAVRNEVQAARWRRAVGSGQGMLSPTTIGGLLLVVKQLADQGEAVLKQNFEAKLKGVASFNFSQYKSSSWGAMAAAIVKDYFS